jgi:hypothetical protein
MVVSLFKAGCKFHVEVLKFVLYAASEDHDSPLRGDPEGFIHLMPLG